MLNLDNQTVEKYIKASRTGFWKLEIENGVAVRMYADPIMQELMGVSPEITPEECCSFFTAHIHTDDLKLTAAYLEEIMRGNAEIVYRYNHPTKGETLVRCGGRCIEKTPNLAVVVGSHMEYADVFRLEENNRSEQWLVKQNRDLQKAQTSAAQYNRSITDRAACGIVHYTLPDREDLYLNAEALRVFGVDSLEEAEQHMDSIVKNVVYRSPADLQKLRSLYSSDGSVDYECTLTGKNGTESALMVHSEVITTAEGKRTVYTTFLDISENESLKNEKHILDALCQDFRSCFYLDFEKETIITTKLNDRAKLLLKDGHVVADFDAYRQNLQAYFDSFVDKTSAPDFLEVLDPANLKEYLLLHQKLTYRFCFINSSGKRHYLEVFGAIAGENQAGAIVGFRRIDDIIAHEERKKTELRKINARLEEQLQTIGGLSNAYFAVYWVDLQTNTCKSLKNISFFEQAAQNLHTIDEVAGAFVGLCVHPEDQAKMQNFTDWRHLNELLEESDTVVEEFHGAVDPWEWCRASWIVAARDSSGKATGVLFSVEDISSAVAEKMQREREKLLLDEQNRVISALSIEYTTVWLVTQNGRNSVNYRDTGRADIARESVIFAEKNRDYTVSTQNYANNFVCEEDREKFLRETQYENVVREIKKQPLFSIIYKRRYEGKEEYFQLCFTAAGGSESSDFIMGFKNVNDLVLEERKRSEILTEALKAADSANAAKTSFLSRMSHDIRTPINGIIGLLQIDKTHSDDKALIESNRNKMQIAANHLLSLINDVLQMSKIEDGSVPLTHEVICFPQLSEEIVTMVEQMTSENDIRLEFKTEKSQLLYPCVYGSPLHLRQIFLNIYGNCVKYNHPGGKIVTTADYEIRDDGICVYEWIISDTGIGMSKEFLQHVFEPFVQEKDDARSAYHGIGLGMAIVKGLVEKMGGTIKVESEPGVGSTFTVQIPFEIADPSENQSSEADSVQNADVRGIKLLLVEDNELNSEIAEILLEDAGAVVTLADNGQKAVDMFRETPAGTFDAILMDVMMPVMDGLTATKKIRALDRPDAKSIPIIAMTANAFTEDAAKCIAAGMNAHLAKPLEIEKVKKVICEQVKSHKKS